MSFENDGYVFADRSLSLLEADSAEHETKCACVSVCGRF